MTTRRPETTAPPGGAGDPTRMNGYEFMFLLDPTLDSAASLAVVERVEGIVKGQGGRIVSLKAWERRRLAYPVRGRNEGLYMLCYFDAPPEAISGIESRVRLAEGVLRFLVLRTDKETRERDQAADARRREEKAAQAAARAQREQEAAAAAAAEAEKEAAEGGDESSSDKPSSDRSAAAGNASDEPPARKAPASGKARKGEKAAGRGRGTPKPDRAAEPAPTAGTEAAPETSGKAGGAAGAAPADGPPDAAASGGETEEKTS